jgi:hypothetical protein
LNGRKQIGEGEALVGEARRALAALPTAVAHAPLLANARLVFKPQRDALVVMCITLTDVRACSAVYRAVRPSDGALVGAANGLPAAR